MDPCSIIEFLLAQKCDFDNAEKINDHIQSKYGSFEFITTIIAKRLNVCTELHLELYKTPRYLLNKVMIGYSCEWYYPSPKFICDERFEVVPVIRLKFEKDSINEGHGITILIDHDEKVIEIFDAHGATRDKSCDTPIYKFLNNIFPDYNILLPEIICPYGPQIFNREGTCALWSILYMFIRIKCRKSTREDINRLFYGISTQKLGYFKKLFYEKSITERATQLILGFGCYLDKLLSSLDLNPLRKYHSKIIDRIENYDGKIIGKIKTSYNLLSLRDYVYYLKKYGLYTSELEDIITSNPLLYEQYLINE